jgi:hypothetical protein
LTPNPILPEYTPLPPSRGDYYGFIQRSEMIFLKILGSAVKKNIG